MLIVFIIPSSVFGGEDTYGVVVGFGAGRPVDRNPRGFKPWTCVTSLADTITDRAKIAYTNT